MAEKSTDKAQQKTSETTDGASEAIGRVTDMALRAGVSTLSPDSMEEFAKASRAMVRGASELSSLWASYWSEQLSTGMQAWRSLAECGDWDEALTVHNKFTRTSLERACSQTLKSAEVTSEMLSSSLAPLQEIARKASERTHRRGA